jgi:hypothetical protein
MTPKFKIGQEVGIKDYSGTFTIHSMTKFHVWVDHNPRPFPISDLYEIDNTPTPKLNTPEEQIALIKAEGEGKTIELFKNGEWGIKCGVGYWSFPRFTYRIKPVTPKKVRKTIVKHAIINLVGNILSIHNTKDEALKRLCPTAKVVTLKGSYYTTEEQ